MFARLWGRLGAHLSHIIDIGILNRHLSRGVKWAVEFGVLS